MCSVSTATTDRVLEIGEKYYNLLLLTKGLGSVVSIATAYGLDGPGIDSQCGRDFPHLSRPALGAHPTSCTIGTMSFPGGVKWREHGVDHPLPSSAEVKERVELYLYFPLWSFVACSRVSFTFTLRLLTLKNSFDLVMLAHGEFRPLDVYDN